MTNAQTEARAILTGRRLAFNNESGAQALIDAIATALAAKDAELARRDMQLEATAKVALDLSAQLAEVNKALKEAADLLADLDQGRSIHNQRFPNEKIDGPLWAQIGRVVSIARRAREQGGE